MVSSNVNVIPYYNNGNIVAECSSCNCVTNWEYKDGNKGQNYGTFYEGKEKNTIIHYALLRCAGCKQGGMAIVKGSNAGYPTADGVLLSFYPVSLSKASLPVGVPKEIRKEFQEAEACLGHDFFRAGSALFRSVLEKTLKMNGFTDGNLKEKIEKLAKIGLITQARKERADQEIRVLGNDVLHDDYKEIPKGDVLAARHYCQRILEDLYDDRIQTENILKAHKIIT